MKNTLICTLFLSVFSSFMLEASHGFSKTMVNIPKIQFTQDISLPITKTCLEEGHVRAKREYQNRHIHLIRPIIQVITYDLGLERKFTLVQRIQTRNRLIETFDMSTPEGRLISNKFFDIPGCEDSIVHHKKELFVNRLPSPQEKMVLSALFQRGITHAETENFLIQRPQYFTPHHSYETHALDAGLEKTFDLKINSHQCSQGIIELTPEFLQYLNSAHGQKSYPQIEESFRLYPEHTEKYFNRVWNNFLRNQPLYRTIGGEGSGSGRVGFGLAIGGEGSGSGRRLEDLSTNALILGKGGEVVINVNMDAYHFYGLSYTQNIIQRFFKVNNEYIPYLNEGALIPSSIINVDCRR